jgi:hypothetical protein
MPTIKESVQSNQAYQAQNPKPSSPTTTPAATMPLITFQAATNLPMRSSLPPGLFSGDYATPGSSPSRPLARSSTFSSVQVSANSRTSQSLSNKKLVAPVIGGGSALNRYNALKVIITPTSVAANTTVTQTFTVAGIQAADKVAGWQWQAAQKTGVMIIAMRVTGDNQLAIDFSNPTGGALVPTGGVISIFLLR